MELRIKRIVPVEAEITYMPKRSNPTDAGLDIYCQYPFVIRGGHSVLVSAGFAMAIPDGYVGRILPRSGLAVKFGIDVLAGVIDSGYRGEVKVALINHGAGDVSFNDGDRIAQLVIQKIELWVPVEVYQLDDTERGEGGFGSTGA